MISKNLIIVAMLAVAGLLYASDQKNVEFSQDEYDLLRSMVSGFSPNPQLQDLPHHTLVWAHECGFGVWSRPTSYDPNVYPDCPKVLEFLKYYIEKKSKFEAELRKESVDFYHTLQSSKKRYDESQPTDSK